MTQFRHEESVCKKESNMKRISTPLSAPVFSGAHNALMSKRKSRKSFELPVKIAALTTTLLMLGGCVSKSNDVFITVNTPVPNQANVIEMQNVKEMAVVSINGESKVFSNKRFKSRLESHLRGIRVEGQPYFQLSDEASSSTLLSADYEVKLSKRPYGNKSRSCIKQTIVKPTRTESVVNNDRPRSIPHPVKECAQWQDNSSNNCSSNRATVTFTPTIVSAADGRVILEKTYSTHRATKNCGRSSTKSDHALVQTALFAIFKEFSHDIAPHHDKVFLPLIKDDETPGEQKEILLDEVTTLVKKGRISRACNMLWSQAEENAQSPAVLYNLGVCWQHKGDWSQAMGYYEKASALSSKLSKEDKAKVVSAIQML